MKNAKSLIVIACIIIAISSAAAMRQASCMSSQPPPTPTQETSTPSPAPAKITITGSDGETKTIVVKPTKPSHTSVPIPENIHGLNNIGASCYLNSLVQILYHTKTIHQYISSAKFESVETQNLKLLFEDMDKAAKSAVVNPAARYRGMKFHRGSDDPQYVFLAYFAKDLEKIIDLDSEMDNPVLLDGTPQVDKTKEKNKPVPEDSTPAEEKNTATTPILTDSSTKVEPKTKSDTFTSPLITPPERTPKGKIAVGFSIATCKSGGHYYAIVKEDGKWFKINDSSASYVGNTYESVISCVKRAGHLFRFAVYE